MLRPANRVADRCGLVWAGGGAKCVRNVQEHVARNPAGVFYKLGRIARKVTLQNLEDTAWMLQSFVCEVLVDSGFELGFRLAMTQKRKRLAELPDWRSLNGGEGYPQLIL